MAKTFVLLGVSVGLAAAAAIACGTPAAGEATSRRSSAIQGGQSTGNYAFAVGVKSEHGTCSGTLIAPNLALTARHCVQDVLEDPDAPDESLIDCAKTEFDGEVDAAAVHVTTCADMDDAACERWYPTAQIVLTPGTRFCGGDMALLILERSVAADEATPATPAVQLAVDDRTLQRAFTAVGYGATQPPPENSAETPPGAGLRRIKQNIPIQCVPGARLASFDCDGRVPDGVITASEFLGGGGTCVGDSGSGALEQSSFTAGKPLVLGVLSRGGAVDGQCEDGVYTRVDRWRDLIVDAANEAARRGGYPSPAWTAPLPAVDVDAAGQPADAPAPKPTAGDGEACTQNDACTSGMCVSRRSGETRVCTTACKVDRECTVGSTCTGGFCFLAGPAAAAAGDAPPASPGGCTASGHHGGGRSGAWSALAALALAGAARVRRRAPIVAKSDGVSPI